MYVLLYCHPTIPYDLPISEKMATRRAAWLKLIIFPFPSSNLETDPSIEDRTSFGVDARVEILKQQYLPTFLSRKSGCQLRRAQCFTPGLCLLLGLKEKAW